MSQESDAHGGLPEGESTNAQSPSGDDDATESSPDGAASLVQENAEATSSPPDSEAHADAPEPNGPGNEASAEPSVNEAPESEEQVGDEVEEEEEDGDEDDEDGEEDDEMVMPPVDEDQLAMLIDFGFPEVRARRCLMHHFGSVEECVEWLLEHGEDDGIDDPIPMVPRSSLLLMSSHDDDLNDNDEDDDGSRGHPSEHDLHDFAAAAPAFGAAPLHPNGMPAFALAPSGFGGSTGSHPFPSSSSPPPSSPGRFGAPSGGGMSFNFGASEPSGYGAPPGGLSFGSSLGGPPSLRGPQPPRSFGGDAPLVRDRPALTVGQRVERGPNWKWGSQDLDRNGHASVGTVMSTHDDPGRFGSQRPGWVLIRWNNSSSTRERSYRDGVERCYDLQPVVDQRQVDALAAAAGAHAQAMQAAAAEDTEAAEALSANAAAEAGDGDGVVAATARAVAAAASRKKLAEAIAAAAAAAAFLRTGGVRDDEPSSSSAGSSSGSGGSYGSGSRTSSTSSKKSLLPESCDDAMAALESAVATARASEFAWPSSLTRASAALASLKTAVLSMAVDSARAALSPLVLDASSSSSSDNGLGADSATPGAVDSSESCGKSGDRDDEEVRTMFFLGNAWGDPKTAFRLRFIGESGKVEGEGVNTNGAFTVDGTWPKSVAMSGPPPTADGASGEEEDDAEMKEASAADAATALSSSSPSPGTFDAPASPFSSFSLNAAPSTQASAFEQPAASGGGAFGTVQAPTALGNPQPNAFVAAPFSFGPSAGAPQQQHASGQGTAGANCAAHTENLQTAGEFSGTLGYQCLTAQPQLAHMSLEECRLGDQAGQPHDSGAAGNSTLSQMGNVMAAPASREVRLVMHNQYGEWPMVLSWEAAKGAPSTTNDNGTSTSTSTSAGGRLVGTARGDQADGPDIFVAFVEQPNEAALASALNQNGRNSGNSGNNGMSFSSFSSSSSSSSPTTTWPPPLKPPRAESDGKEAPWPIAMRVLMHKDDGRASVVSGTYVRTQGGAATAAIVNGFPTWTQLARAPPQPPPPPGTSTAAASVSPGASKGSARSPQASADSATASSGGASGGTSGGASTSSSGGGSGNAEKELVLYSTKTGRWAITTSDQVQQDRNMACTEAHGGKQPPDVAWGKVKSGGWQPSRNVSVTRADAPGSTGAAVYALSALTRALASVSNGAGDSESAPKSAAEGAPKGATSEEDSGSADAAAAAAAAGDGASGNESNGSEDMAALVASAESLKSQLAEAAVEDALTVAEGALSATSGGSSTASSSSGSNGSSGSSGGGSDSASSASTAATVLFQEAMGVVMWAERQGLVATSVLDKAQTRIEVLEKQRAQADIDAGCSELSALLAIARVLATEASAVTVGRGHALPGTCTSLTNADQANSRSESGAGDNGSIGALGLWRCEGLHGVAYRSVPEMSKRCDDHITGPNSGELFEAVLMELPPSFSGIVAAGTSNDSNDKDEGGDRAGKAPAASATTSCGSALPGSRGEGWVKVEVPGRGTFFLPLTKDGQVLLTPLPYDSSHPRPRQPGSTLNSVSSGFDSSSGRAPPTLERSTSSSSAAFASTTTSTTLIVGLGDRFHEHSGFSSAVDMGGQRRSSSAGLSSSSGSGNGNFTVLLQPIDPDAPAASSAAADSLKSHITGGLANVFNEWPRAGWSDGGRAFTSAFESSMTSADQVVVAARGVSEDDAIALARMLAERAKSLGFATLTAENWKGGRVGKARGKGSGHNGHNGSGLPAPGTTRSGRGALGAARAGPLEGLGGGRGAEAIKLLDSFTGRLARTPALLQALSVVPSTSSAETPGAGNDGSGNNGESGSATGAAEGDSNSSNAVTNATHMDASVRRELFAGLFPALLDGLEDPPPPPGTDTAAAAGTAITASNSSSTQPLPLLLQIAPALRRLRPCLATGEGAWLSAVLRELVHVLLLLLRKRTKTAQGRRGSSSEGATSSGAALVEKEATAAAAAEREDAFTCLLAIAPAVGGGWLSCDASSPEGESLRATSTQAKERGEGVVEAASFEGRATNADLARFFAVFEERASSAEEGQARLALLLLLLQALVESACGTLLANLPLPNAGGTQTADAEESKTETASEEVKSGDSGTAAATGEEGDNNGHFMLEDRLEEWFTRCGVRATCAAAATSSSSSADAKAAAARVLALIGRENQRGMARETAAIAALVHALAPSLPPNSAEIGENKSDSGSLALAAESSPLVSSTTAAASWATAVPLLASKLASPSGITQHEYESLGVGVALARWLQMAPPAARLAFLEAFLNESKEALTSSSSSFSISSRKSALVRVILRAQAAVAQLEALTVFKHRNPDDILETTSKAMDLRLFFKDAPLMPAKDAGNNLHDDEDEEEDEEKVKEGDASGHDKGGPTNTQGVDLSPLLPRLENCVVKATRTSHVRALEAHVLRALPAAALPESYRAASRDLVGMLVQERASSTVEPPHGAAGAAGHNKARNSSQNSGKSNSCGGDSTLEWRTCVVLAYDEDTGAHCVSYAAAQTLRARGGQKKGSVASPSPADGATSDENTSGAAVAAAVDKSQYDGCWLRLPLRDVTVIERVGPPQPLPDLAEKEANRRAIVAARKAKKAQEAKAAADALAEEKRKEEEATAAALAEGRPLIAQVEVSGHSGRHHRFNGIYEEERGRIIHGAKLFRTADTESTAPDASNYVLFRSSGTGKWVITDNEANFDSNQGFLRCAANPESGLPTSPGEQFPGSGDWMVDPSMRVVTTQRAVPEAQSSSGAHHHNYLPDHPPMQWHRGVRGENAALRGPVVLRSNSYGDATVFTGLPLPSAPAPPKPRKPRGGRHAQHYPRGSSDSGSAFSFGDASSSSSSRTEPHLLEECPVGSGWSCDGSPQCLSHGGGRGQMRFRCVMPGCDYDLCLPCWESGAIEDQEANNDEGGEGGGSSGETTADSPSSTPASGEESATQPPSQASATAASTAASATATAAAAALQPAKNARSFTVEVESYGSSYSGTLRVGLTAKDPTTFARRVPAMLGALGSDTVYLDGHKVVQGDDKTLGVVSCDLSEMRTGDRITVTLHDQDQKLYFRIERGAAARASGSFGSARSAWQPIRGGGGNGSEALGGPSRLDDGVPMPCVFATGDGSPLPVWGVVSVYGQTSAVRLVAVNGCAVAGAPTPLQAGAEGNLSVGTRVFRRRSGSGNGGDAQSGARHTGGGTLLGWKHQGQVTGDFGDASSLPDGLCRVDFDHGGSWNVYMDECCLEDLSLLDAGGMAESVAASSGRSKGGNGNGKNSSLSTTRKRTAKVERWLRGSIQLRSMPEFPGNNLRTSHTLEANDCFAYTRTVVVKHALLLAEVRAGEEAQNGRALSSSTAATAGDSGSNASAASVSGSGDSSAQKEEGDEEKMVHFDITYYELADGRGWIHDFDRDHLHESGMRLPSIRKIKDPLLGKRLRLKSDSSSSSGSSMRWGEKGGLMQDVSGLMATVLSVDSFDDTVDLVLDDGRCLLKQPRHCLAEADISAASSSSGSGSGGYRGSRSTSSSSSGGSRRGSGSAGAAAPPPLALQRTFTAVSTEQRSVSNGGFEFTRREDYVNVDSFLTTAMNLAENASGGRARDYRSGGGGEGSSTWSDESTSVVNACDASPALTRNSSSSGRQRINLQRNEALHPRLEVRFRLAPSSSSSGEQGTSRDGNDDSSSATSEDLAAVDDATAHSAEPRPTALRSGMTMFQAAHKLAERATLAAARNPPPVNAQMNGNSDQPQTSSSFEKVFALPPAANDDAFDLECSVVVVGNNENNNSETGMSVGVENDRNGEVSLRGRDSPLTSQQNLELAIQSGSNLSEAIEVLYALRAVLLEGSAHADPKIASNPNSTSSVAAAAASLLRDESLWVNPSLERKLSTQLKPLAVVTGAVPSWVRWLPRVVPFLWSKKTRERQMRCMAFGVSRGIVAMQEDRHPIAALEREVAACFQLMTAESLERAQRLEQTIQRMTERHATSPLARNTLTNVAVSPGWQLLAQAEAVFANVPFLRSGSLEVTFAGETGFGSGVTAGFYSRVAQEFQTRAVGRNLLRVGASPPPPLLSQEAVPIAANVAPAEAAATSSSGRSSNGDEDASTSSKQDDSSESSNKIPREDLVSFDASGCGAFNGLFGEASGRATSSSGHHGPGANRLRAVLSVHRVSVPRPTQVLTANGYATEALLLRAEKQDTVPLQPQPVSGASSESGGDGNLSLEFALAGPEEDEEDDEEEEDSEETGAVVENSQVDDAADGQPLTVAVSPSAWAHVRGRDVLRRSTLLASSSQSTADTTAAPAAEAKLATEAPEAASDAAVGEKDSSEAGNDNDNDDGDDGGSEYPLAAVLLPEPFPGTFAVMRRPPRRLPPISPSKDDGLSTHSSSGHHHSESAKELPCVTVLYRETAVTNPPSQSNASASAAAAAAAVPQPCPGSVALLAAMGGRNGGVASGGRGLEFWTTEHSAHDRSTRSAKVSVVPGSAALPRWVRGDDDASSSSSSSSRWEIEFEVEGPLPSAWAPPGEVNSAPPSPARTSSQAEDDNTPSKVGGSVGSSGGPTTGKVHVGVAVQGAPWSAPLFVPDRESSPHGSTEVPRGLFPAPLPPGADGDLVLRRFTFLGRLFGKALVDGHLFPLRLHPTFFALVRGDHLDPSTYFAAAPSHHLDNCHGAHLAPLFALLPELEAIENKHPLSFTNSAADNAAAERKRTAALNELLSEPRDFTQGLPLADWLEFLPWADPITGAALLQPPPPLSSASTLANASALATPLTAPTAAAASSASMSLGWYDDDNSCSGGVDSAGEVNGNTLKCFLLQLGDLWLGRGVAQQAAAFRRGLSDMASLDAGVLAFEPSELRDLLAGPDQVEWTTESLKRILRPKGDFVLPASSSSSSGSRSSSSSSSPLRRRALSASSPSCSNSSHSGVDTLEWLRDELVALSQPDRLKFLELTTGVRCLTPDKVITVRRTDQRWPFFHSCTNQLDLPRFESQEALKDGLRAALANGTAGGFSEFAHIGSGADA